MEKRKVQEEESLSKLLGLYIYLYIKKTFKEEKKTEFEFVFSSTRIFCKFVLFFCLVHIICVNGQKLSSFNWFLGYVIMKIVQANLVFLGFFSSYTFHVFLSFAQALMIFFLLSHLHIILQIQHFLLLFFKFQYFGNHIKMHVTS